MSCADLIVYGFNNDVAVEFIIDNLKQKYDAYEMLKRGFYEFNFFVGMQSTPIGFKSEGGSSKVNSENYKNIIFPDSKKYQDEILNMVRLFNSYFGYTNFKYSWPLSPLISSGRSFGFFTRHSSTSWPARTERL
jgi:hypothetical protein